MRIQELFSKSAAIELRQMSKRVRKFYERQCGDSNERCSVYVTKEDEHGHCFEIVQYHNGGETRRRVTNVERRATTRLKQMLATVEKKHDIKLYAYWQTDCRGCALYLSTREELNDCNYSSFGVAPEGWTI